MAKTAKGDQKQATGGATEFDDLSASLAEGGSRPGAVGKKALKITLSLENVTDDREDPVQEDQPNPAPPKPPIRGPEGGPAVDVLLPAVRLVESKPGSAPRVTFAITIAE